MISLAPFPTLLRLKKGQHLLLANAAQTVGFHYNPDSPVVLHIYPSVIRILFPGRFFFPPMAIIYHKHFSLSMQFSKFVIFLPISIVFFIQSNQNYFGPF